MDVTEGAASAAASDGLSHALCVVNHLINLLDGGRVSV